jgi:glutathione S-transferase
MRQLYHFSVSPYSRRVRLALLHKKVPVELRDALGNAALLEEAQRLGAMKTVPIFVEEDGRVLGDSTAITHYLDRAHPAGPPIWPTEGDDAFAVFEAASLTDAALGALADPGIRYFNLRDASAWESVRKEYAGRAQRGIDALADRVSSLSRPTVAASGWSGADMWIFTFVEWLEALPKIASEMAFAAQVLTFGYTLPPALQRWADQHREREDVRALRQE